MGGKGQRRARQTLRLLTRPADEIRRQAERLQPALAAHYADFAVNVHGSLRQRAAKASSRLPRPSWGVKVNAAPGRRSTGNECPVIGRIYDGRLWLDLRCLEDETRFMEMLLRWLLGIAEIDRHSPRFLFRQTIGIHAGYRLQQRRFAVVIYDGRLWLDLRCLEDETRFMEMLLRWLLPPLDMLPGMAACASGPPKPPAGCRGRHGG
jgi:seryl-tRNA(Sec) selenium transferase